MDDDDELFPGFVFDRKDPIKEIYDRETVNPLEGLPEDILIQEEKRILKQQRKYGTLTTFKGKEEMKDFRNRLLAKSHITQLHTKVQETRSTCLELQERISTHQSHQVNSRNEMERILKEAADIIRNTFSKAAADQKVKHLIGEYKFPRDTELMYNARYKYLLDHFERHYNLLNEAEKQLPVLLTKLNDVSVLLEALEEEEQGLEPLQKELNRQDRQEFAKVQVVAKYRALELEQKQVEFSEKMSQLQAQKREKQQKEWEEKQEKRGIFATKVVKVEERLKQSKIKREAEKAELLLSQKLEKEKLEAELAKVQDHIKKNYKKIIPKVDSMPDLVDESSAKRRAEKTVERHLKSKETEKFKRQLEMEKRAQAILNRVIELESPRKKIPPIPPRESPLPTPTVEPVMEQPIQEIINTEEEPAVKRHLPPPNILNYEPNSDKVITLANNHAFLCTPEEFIFEDFELNKPMVKKATITNISGRINSFRFCGVPVELSNYFEIEFVPAGKMSPGVTVDVTIKFTPPGLYDIPPTSIMFASELGDPFFFTIGCRTKRCDPRIASISGLNFKTAKFHKKTEKHTQVSRDVDIYRLVGTPATTQPLAAILKEDVFELNFGQVVVGMSQTLSLDLTNFGAIPADFSIIPIEESSSSRLYGPGELGNAFIFKKQQGQLGPYESSLLMVDFCPPYINLAEDDLKQKTVSVKKEFVLKFKNVEYKLVCCGSVIESPIVLNTHDLQMKIICTDQIYQNVIKVINYENFALKLWLETPFLEGEMIKVPNFGEITMTPIVAFLQPYETTDIWFHIKTYRDVFQGSRPFCIPLTLKYMDAINVERSIPLTIQGDLTTVDILLSCNGESIVNFGPTSTQEAKQLPLTIKNASVLSQKLKYLKGHSSLSLSIDEDYITLNPLQSIECLVFFEPNKNGDHNMKLSFQNTWSRVYHIDCHGIGMKPLASFDENVIDFDPCAYGSTSHKRIRIHAETDAFFDFGLPIITAVNGNSVEYVMTESDPTLVQIWPISGVLAPNVPSSLELTACPTRVTDAGGIWDQVNSTASPTVTFLLPCYLRPTISSQNRIKALISGVPPAAEPNSYTSNIEDDQAKTIFIKITLPIVSPNISSVIKYDFGKIPVGEKVFAAIPIQNLSDEEISVKLQGLNPMGPFYQVNAVKTIRDIGKVSLGFKPEKVSGYSSILTVSSDTTQSTIACIGEGVESLVSTAPALHMGDILVGDSITKQIILKNHSVIPMPCSLRFSTVKNEFGTRNFSGSNPFVLSDIRFVIDAQSEKIVQVTFTPDRESDTFFNVIHVDYWGQTAPLTVQVDGRGWETSGIIAGYNLHPPSFLSNIWALPKHKELPIQFRKLYDSELSANIETLQDEQSVALNLLNRNDRFVTFTFPWKQTDGKWSLEFPEISLVNFKLKDKKSPALEYKFELFDGSFEFDAHLNDYVVIDGRCDSKIDVQPAIGQVEAGGQKTLSLSLVNPVQKFWETFEPITTTSTPNNHQDISKLTLPDQTISYKKPEFTPFPIETVYKVTTTGIRSVEPKVTDTRIWYCKLKSIQ